MLEIVTHYRAQRTALYNTTEYGAHISKGPQAHRERQMGDQSDRNLRMKEDLVSAEMLQQSRKNSFIAWQPGSIVRLV